MNVMMNLDMSSLSHLNKDKVKAKWVINIVARSYPIAHEHEATTTFSYAWKTHFKRFKGHISLVGIRLICKSWNFFTAF